MQPYRVMRMIGRDDQKGILMLRLFCVFAVCALSTMAMAEETRSSLIAQIEASG